VVNTLAPVQILGLCLLAAVIGVHFGLRRRSSPEAGALAAVTMFALLIVSILLTVAVSRLTGVIVLASARWQAAPEPLSLTLIPITIIDAILVILPYALTFNLLQRDYPLGDLAHRSDA
jgi:hypothetical protein